MQESKQIEVNALIEMLGHLASMDFTKRLSVDNRDEPLDVVAHGLNMLSEELEAHAVRLSLLEDINKNLERFSFSVAHDISSPLNTAIGITSMMEEALASKNYEELGMYLTLLIQVHDRASKLVKGILEYSKVNYNDAETSMIHFDRLCSEIVGELAITQPVSAVFEGEFVPFKFNEVALRQILYNLCNNAVKHNDKQECILDVSQTVSDHYIQLGVADNGPGIDPAYSDRIFDLFESLKKNDTDSYGIGLSTVKKLVTQAGGDIWLESEAGKGTKF
jgi:signal transduction histidine kinase